MSLTQASRALIDGELVVFPTETVYGLGARADRPQAVQKIYHVKGRPSHNPLIVHVADVSMAKDQVTQWTSLADELAERFWPGPLTLVLSAQSHLPDVVRAGGHTIALRIPSHPIARALLDQTGLPIAAPSANRSGHISPTQARHVQRSLEGQDIRFILDGGPTQFGIESTVVDVRDEKIILLRPGGVSAADLEKIAPVEIYGKAEGPPGPHLSPGLSTRHYAPEAKVFLFDRKEFETVLEVLAKFHLESKRTALFTHTGLSAHASKVKRMPSQALEYGQELFAALYEAEDLGCHLIAIETPPRTTGWEAVHDRLVRAAVQN